MSDEILTTEELMSPAAENIFQKAGNAIGRALHQTPKGAVVSSDDLFGSSDQNIVSSEDLFKPEPNILQKGLKSVQDTIQKRISEIENPVFNAHWDAANITLGKAAQAVRAMAFDRKLFDQHLQNDKNIIDKMSPAALNSIYGTEDPAKAFEIQKEKSTQALTLFTTTVDNLFFHIPSALGKETGLDTGVAAEAQAKNKTIASVGGAVGDLGSLLMTGGLLNMTKLPMFAEKAGEKAVVFKVGGKAAEKFWAASPRFIPRTIIGSATFGVDTALQDTFEQARDGEVDPLKLGKDVIDSTLLGGFIHGVGGFVNIPIAVASASGIGFSYAKYHGADNLDAGLQGAAFGLWEWAGSIGRDPRLRAETINYVRNSMADWAVKKNPGLKPDVAKTMADGFINRTATEMGGMDFVLKSKENTVSYLEEVNKKIQEAIGKAEPGAKPAEEPPASGLKAGFKPEEPAPAEPGAAPEVKKVEIVPPGAIPQGKQGIVAEVSKNMWQSGAEPAAAVPGEPIAFYGAEKDKLDTAKATISYEEADDHTPLGYRVELSDGAGIPNPESDKLGGSPYFDTVEKAQLAVENHFQTLKAESDNPLNFKTAEEYVASKKLEIIKPQEDIGVFSKPEHFDLGKSGISDAVEYPSKDRPLMQGRDYGSLVYRDGSGKPQGVLTFKLDAQGKIETNSDLGSSIEVFVNPEYRRQGIATKLYDKAKQLGFDVNKVKDRVFTKEGLALQKSQLTAEWEAAHKEALNAKGNGNEVKAGSAEKGVKGKEGQRVRVRDNAQGRVDAGKPGAIGPGGTEGKLVKPPKVTNEIKPGDLAIWNGKAASVDTVEHDMGVIVVNGKKEVVKIKDLKKVMTAEEAADIPEIVDARAQALAIPETITNDTPERRAMDSDIARRAFGEGNFTKGRRADFVIGGPASGKSQVVDPLVKEHGALKIDNDDYKIFLPEYADGIGAAATHKESALIEGIVRSLATADGNNLVIARLGKNPEAIRDVMKHLKELGYTKFYLHLTELPVEKAMLRTVLRFAERGRFADPLYVKKVGLTPRETYDTFLKEGIFDGYAKYNTDVPKGTPPVVESDVGGVGRTQPGVHGLAGPAPENRPRPSAGVKKPAAVPAPEIVPTQEIVSETKASPAVQETKERVARMVPFFVKLLNDGTSLKDPVALRNMVGEEIGGTPKDYYDEIYDSLEMALNIHARKDLATGIHGTLFDTLRAAQALEDKLPLRNRSLQTIEKQQFSTPLTLATAANYALDPQQGDIILEPTAGTGNLIVPFWNGRWNLVANELDPRRAEVLKNSGIEMDVKTGDFLKFAGVNFSAIISNPPFGGLSTGKYPGFAADFEASNLDQRFIAKMLRMLPSGGRIAVITSQGTGSGVSGAPFRKWLAENHTFIASIASPEGAYKHRGSPTIGTSLLVIEKGRQRKRGNNENVKPIIKETTADWADYAKQLEAVRERFKRLAFGSPSAILKSGGQENVPVPAASGVVRSSTGGPAGSSAGRDIGRGGQEPIARPPERPAELSAEQPGSGTGVEDDVGQGSAPGRTGVQPELAAPRSAGKRIGSFVEYQRNNTLPVVNPHPSIIVESQELASVTPPKITYRPGKMLMDSYKAHNISDQAMDIVLQARQSMTAGRGFLIADDVGVGKTREMAAIAMDALDIGKANRVLYVTINKEVLDNHVLGDFAVVMSGAPNVPLPFPTIRLDAIPNISKQASLPVQDKAMYFVSLDVMKKHHARILDIGFDTIIFDEAHRWRPKNEKQAKAIAWTRIHTSAVGKPMIYATATPGIDLSNLDYLYGLGEWTKQTFDTYLSNITGAEAEKKGMFTKTSAFTPGASIPLTQQFMREMKMKGLYASRDLSRENVKFSVEKLPFSDMDVQNYDRYIAFLKKAYTVGVKYSKFNKVSGARSLGLVKAMMQNAAKRHQVDQKIERIIPNVQADIAAGKRVFIFTSGLNGLDEDAPKGYARAVIEAIEDDQVESIQGEIFSEKIPEAIEEKNLLLDEINQFPPQLSLEKYVKDKLGKQYRLGYYTGNTTNTQKKKYLAEWNAGKIDVMLGSDAAKTAISAHDIIGKPIVNYYLDVDFEVTKFKQALGRTNRAGEKTSPHIIIPSIGAAGEQKFISTVAVRMKNLGATSKGQAESGVVDFLSDYDLEGAIANQAARAVFSGISDSDKELFINEKLWGTAPDGTRRPRRVAPNDFRIDNFLFDLNFMPYTDGNRIFEKLIQQYKEIVNTSSELAALRAERVTGKEVKNMKLYQNPENENDYVVLHDVQDKAGDHFGIVTGMLLEKAKILNQHGVKNFIKFTTPDGIITGKKVLPSYIPGLALSFGKDIASSITPDNAFDVIMSGDKVPLIGNLFLYKRKDGYIGVRNAKMADKNALTQAGAGFSPVGNAWALKQTTKAAVAEFLKYYPITQTTIDKVEKQIIEEGLVTPKRGAGMAGESGQAAAGFSQRKPVSDKVEGLGFTDPEIEKRYKEARGVETNVQAIKGNIRNFFGELFNRATRVYPALPNDPKYSQFRNILNRQKFARPTAQDRTIRAIDAITAGFGPNKLDLFTRKVILDDLVEEAKAGRALPFGYSKQEEDGSITTDTDQLAEDHQKINALVDQNEDVRAAVNKRRRLWSAISSELVERGILKDEQIKDNYFRHQVLEYARVKATFTTGKKLHTPRPGYAKRRRGSLYDINTDYIQAEFEVMAQSMADIETAKNIKEIEDGPLNIVQMLRDKAKEMRANGEDVTWQQLIPEGYRTWQPAEGNIFYRAVSLPERIINEVMGSTVDSVEIKQEDLRQILAMGGKKKQFVLPNEVADTLDNLYQVKNPNFVTYGVKLITTRWKQWVLFNPRRAFKYNYQNFLGDFDAVVAGDPRILKRFSQSFGELTDVFYRGLPMTPDMREFFERGGLTSTLTVNELPELRNTEIFVRLLNQKEYVQKQLKFWQKYWNSVTTLTTFRESVLRYAAYLHYKEMFSGTDPVNYGASMKDEVNALSTVEDKAAKVATELLGDYANISSLGQDLRTTAMPFFSWLEINLKRYARLTRNAFEEGWGQGIKTSATLAALKGGRGLITWAMRAAAMTAAVILYNQIFWGEEEQELSEYDRNRLHITVGRMADGRIVILRGQGALGDMLEWFGLDSAPTLWQEYIDGKTSFVGIVGRIPWTNLPAFGLNPLEGKIGLHQTVMKILRGVNPLYKVPFESWTGKSVPVFDDRSWKIEDKMRNIMRAISLEHEYDAVMQKPSRGWGRSLMEVFVAVNDPGENAYRYIQGEKYKFLETVKGRGGSSDYYSPRSILYRQYKAALRYGDTDAEERIKTQMDAQGITPHDIFKSLKMADPLSGLSRKDKAEFINIYLSDHDRKVLLDRAMIYYKQTFLNE